MGYYISDSAFSSPSVARTKIMRCSMTLNSGRWRTGWKFAKQKHAALRHLIKRRAEKSLTVGFSLPRNPAPRNSRVDGPLGMLAGRRRVDPHAREMNAGIDAMNEGNV